MSAINQNCYHINPGLKIDNIQCVSVKAFNGGVSTGYVSRFSIFTDSQNIIRVRSGIINKFLLCGDTRGN